MTLLEKAKRGEITAEMQYVAEKEGVTEELKATDQMKWVQKMNNIRKRVIEVVNAEVVFV